MQRRLVLQIASDRFRATADVELLVDAAKMRAHREVTNPQAIGDLLIPEPFAQLREDLHLAFGQILLLPFRSWLVKGINDQASDLAAHRGAACPHLRDRAKNFFGSGTFE